MPQNNLFGQDTKSKLLKDGDKGDSSSIYTPNSNLSISTLNSNQSNQKLNNGRGSQVKEASRKLQLNSSLLNRIRERNTDHGFNGKKLSSNKLEAETVRPMTMAIKPSKIVNMYEVNNYYGGLRDERANHLSLDDDGLSGHKTVNSQRLESKLKEMTKERISRRDNLEPAVAKYKPLVASKPAQNNLNRVNPEAISSPIRKTITKQVEKPDAAKRELGAKGLESRGGQKIDTFGTMMKKLEERVSKRQDPNKYSRPVKQTYSDKLF